MMTVLEYALDVNKTVEFVLKKCQNLGINVSGEDDLLSDEDITILDSELANEEESFSHASRTYDGPDARIHGRMQQAGCGA